LEGELKFKPNSRFHPLKNLHKVLGFDSKFPNFHLGPFDEPVSLKNKLMVPLSSHL
jgi:hypothetical protein